MVVALCARRNFILEKLLTHIGSAGTLVSVMQGVKCGNIRDEYYSISTSEETKEPSETAQSAQSLKDFNSVVHQYEKQLFNQIYQWIGDYDEAEELTQETFISAYRAREQFRGESQIYTWLYRIAYNHCKNRFKQRDRQRIIEGPSLDAGVADDDGGDDLISETREIADWSFSPSQILEQKELRTLVDRAVNSLAYEYKVVLVLREMDGLSYNEIAEVTGLTIEAVKTRLNRARGMVRKRVEPYYNT